MDKFDETTIETLKAGNIGEDLLRSLSRDDIKDLFPGPEHFLRRRALWLAVNDEKVETAVRAMEPTKPSDVADVPPEEKPNTSKFLKMSGPEYIVYTDGELEQARSSFFEQKRLGTTPTELSKELFCRLIRNTMTNMISIARALQESRYPSKHEVDSMAKRLVEYYPMLKDNRHVAKRLMKRLSNVKSPKKASTPSKRRRLTFEKGDSSDFDGDSTSSSQASTIILEKSPTTTSTPEPSHESSEDEAVSSPDLLDSQKSQSRHYKTLQDMYKSKKPNKAAVTHLLNLEFEARRRFITCGVLKESERPTKVLEAYPCFKELDHVLDEMQRIVQPKNSNFIAESMVRWEDFFSKVKFYGVMKKAMKLPKTLNSADHALAVFTALPDLFPSGVSPPKKLGPCSEAFFHVLKTAEDPEGYLQQRPLSCPVLLISKDNCMIAIDNTPVTTFASTKLDEGLVYLMAYYYAFHLTYPKCISTLLSVMQTEILMDSIHDRDTTSTYKKAIAEWRTFTE